MTVPAGAPVPVLAPSEDAPVWHTLRADQVLHAEKVDGPHGLSSAEAEAIGLGYGQPAAGLMERRPRAPEEPILTRGQFAWLISVGLVMGIGTLGVISWAEQAHTREIAHTMGVVTFSLYALFFSIATRDERRTVFSLDTFADAKFLIATGVSVVTLLLTTVFSPLQSFLNTTSLDVRQWLICLAVALSIVVVAEIRKAVRRRTASGQKETR